jgi:photosystem II stability/assembly factor-like uncharacterized protein
MIRQFSVVAAVSALFVPAIAQEAPSESALPQMLGQLVPRELGPSTMGGRVMDIAVYEPEPRIFYVGFASGGVFKTTSAGTRMAPVFDKQPHLSVGSVAVSQKDPNVVWVGTGEPSSRNSTSWGGGVFKSEDGGASWTNVGLEGTRHIGKLAIHPKDDKIVLVGALGPLWAEGGERGIFRTDDGGKTWKQTLDTGTKAGIIDLVFDPKNPNNVLAASWERRRWAYDFVSRGPGSALWKSTDGGKSWRKVTKGLPEMELGRIGLSVHKGNPKVWIAMVQADRGKSGVYRSEDGGESWTQVNTLNPRPFYFSCPRIDPVDPNRVYVLGVNVHLSTDGGKTFRTLNTPLHSDHHAGWINPADNKHILFGNDGGVGQTRDQGATWSVIDNMAVGQFYGVAFDYRKPYWVYGGLQDNGSWAGPTQTRQGYVGSWHWEFVQGGDGFHMQVDPSDWRIAYAESQGGGASRVNQQTGESRSIRPNPARLGEPEGTRYRFNWSTPIVLSPHNPKTVYIGGNKLFKSVDMGDNWRAISPDLTTNDPDKQKPPRGDQQTGAENHCTIITVGESPAQAGLIWVGTDDGLVHVTTNDGAEWKDVTGNVPGLPRFTWVSRVRPSRHAASRCYATFDGHRNGDTTPYVYVTDDNGATWKSIAAGLPNASVYVVTEGVRNPDLLLVGTEVGMFVSIDRGASWSRLTAGAWPNVRTDDIAIHPRELDAVVGTHGRSIWTINISALEALTAAEREKDVVLVEPQAVYDLGRVPGGWFASGEDFGAPNTQPSTRIFYWLKSGGPEGLKVVVQDAAGREIASLDAPNKPGLNAVDFRAPRNRVRGTQDLSVVLKVGDTEHRTRLRVEQAYLGSDSEQGD